MMRFCITLIGVCLLLTGVVLSAELPKPIIDQDYRNYSTPQIKLGQVLFYDRVLSGTYRVSCATCHNHDRGSSNGFRLDGKDTATGGDDLAINGLAVYDALKPSSKHAPTLFNLGAKEFTVLFLDGRVARDKKGNLISPSSGQLPSGLRDVLAVQALFPAVTGDELIGKVDNDIKSVAHLGNGAVWVVLAKRVQDLPDYWPLFQMAYPKLTKKTDITIVEIANAISAFVGTEWRSNRSKFDAFLDGDQKALSKAQARGMKLFYGAAQCAGCHQGKFQTDHGFHFVPNLFWRFDATEKERGKNINFGRYQVSGKQADIFKNRTPSLRNVSHTAPYGHAGGVKSLRRMIWLHLNPEAAVDGMRGSLERLGLKDKVEQALQASNRQMEEANISGKDISDLMHFLEALSDVAGLKGRLGKPKSVPSSLVLD